MFLSKIFLYVYDVSFLYQFVASLSTYMLLRIILFYSARGRRYKLLRLYGIPGPEPRLLDGSLWLYRASKNVSLVDEEFQRKYGKVFGFFIGDEPNIVVTDLELIRKIFLEKHSAFRERCHIFLDSPLTKSLLFAQYDRWKTMRKIISPAFSTFTMRGQTSTNFIEETLKLMLDYIESRLKDAEANSNGAPARVTVDIHSLMKATALKLITGLAIDLPDVHVTENESYVDSLDAFLSQADSGAVILAIRFPFFARILEFLAAHLEHGKTLSTIRRSLNELIDGRFIRLAHHEDSKLKSPEAQEKQPRLIDTLIKHHYEGKLTREEVIGNCEALLFAGYDTTSTTLVYIFWVLGKHPEIQDKLRSELMAHGTESQYLEQVINETMRLYPTVSTFTTRVASENVSLDNDLTIPKGTTVIYQAWLMHRDPNLWPDPLKFDPERFGKGTHIHPCAFAPFGLGDRKCLGYSLAQLELKMVTCDILCRYRIITKAPNELNLHSYATVITKPSEKIIIELECV